MKEEDLQEVIRLLEHRTDLVEVIRVLKVQAGETSTVYFNTPAGKSVYICPNREALIDSVNLELEKNKERLNELGIQLLV